MIKNERQYRITRAQADDFRAALAELESKPLHSNDPNVVLQRDIRVDSMRSQLDDLQGELDSYVALQDQAHEPMELTSLEELPTALIKARIASGLTQKQLAERLNLKEQQLQRYESNGYAGASLSRLQEVLDALGVKVRKRLTVPELPVTSDSLVSRLTGVGLQKKFVEERLLNPSLRFQNSQQKGAEADVLATADVLSRIFQWTPEQLFSTAPLDVPQYAISHARFKLPAGASRQALPAYTIYAHYLALLLIQATPNVVSRSIPVSWRHIRQQILEKHGSIDLRAITEYIWDLGIVILPLNDAGQFHGATWRFKGRNVIVLKQRTQSEARWIIDLLHELWHAAQNQDEPEHSSIEAEDLYLTAEQQIEEEIATDFAADIVFRGKADALAEMTAKASNGRMEWLKTAVLKVAKANEIRPDLLANYLAFRLSREGKNWWPTAVSMQEAQINPWSLTRDFVASRIKWDALHGQDRTLMEQALTN